MITALLLLVQSDSDRTTPGSVALMRWPGRRRTEAARLVLTEDSHFDAGRVRDLVAILTALGELPRPATVFVEGTSCSAETTAFLRSHETSPGRDDLSGTLWPKAAQFHVPLTDTVVTGLISLAERSAEPEVCDHLVVYRGPEVLLAAYDAGSSDVWISRSLPSQVTDRVKVALGTD